MVQFMKFLYKGLNKYENLSQLKKNVFSGSFSAGINILVTFIAYPIYLKYLGAEKYGLWATVSVVLAFSQIGQLNIGIAITKYVAGEYGKRNFRAITEYVSTSGYCQLCASFR